jgi:hypothetical protein
MCWLAGELAFLTMPLRPLPNVHMTLSMGLMARDSR